MCRRDDRFFMYFEEADLCLRIQRAGWKVGVVLDAIAEQAPGGGARPGAFTKELAKNLIPGLATSGQGASSRAALR